MMISSQRARGLGHRAFYLHPEPTTGSGGSSNGSTRTGGGTSGIESIPDAPEDTAAETALETETADAAQ